MNWIELAGSNRSIASTGRNLLEMWDQSLVISPGQSPAELLTNGKIQKVMLKSTNVFINFWFLKIHTKTLAGMIDRIYYYYINCTSFQEKWSQLIKK